MTHERFIKCARKTWPYAKLVRARKRYPCDWGGCDNLIASGESYVNPGDANTYRAGGFGGYRYCLSHFADTPASGKEN